MAGASITLRSLARQRDGRPVLRGVSMDVAAGEWFALLGPSGSGKSTLLRLIAGLDRPDAGQVQVDGRVGMVFQDLALWPYMSVEEHVSGRPDLLERLDIAAHARKRPHELSGGERQRLALARALASRPRVLLLDEPFSGLDPMLRRTLADVLAEIHRADGLTTVYVSHYLEAPVARASRVALLREGSIEQVGTLAELRTSPASEWVAAFVADEAGVER